MDELRLRVLLVEDDEEDYMIVRGLLREVPSTRYDLTWARTYEEALKAAEGGPHDVYLVDYRLGAHDGLKFLHEMNRGGCKVPAIVLTGQGSYEVDMEAMKSGAADYLVKNQINPSLLERSIRYAVGRAQSEERLHKSEEMMRLIIESSPIGIRICRQSRYVYVNPAFLRMFGYDDPAEITGLPEEILFAPEAGGIARRREVDRTEDGPPPLSYWAKGIKRTGEQFDISVRSTRIDYQGSSATLDFLIDVSAEKILQAKLLQAQKMHSIGTLAGGIAHDFNNILGIVLGFTELALGELPRGTRLYGNLENSIQAIHRGIDLVNQILTFSRGSEQARGPLHLAPLVKEALKLVRASLPATIEIRHRLDLPPEDDVVLSDPTQIHQVLLNLCSNSAHAMTERGGVLEVKLSTVRFEPDDLGLPPDTGPGNYIKLCVSDTGHGIDSSIIDNIFDPYFTTKGHGEGTGLGLGVVHGIVRRHGGAVTVCSEPGEQTSFEIFLPKYGGEVISEPEPAGSLPTGNETILLVDDEERLVDAGTQILERLGYTVVGKTSAAEALDAFLDRPEAFDLVITDQTMPRKTGLELAADILRARPDTPLILCTGFSEIAAMEKFETTGIREFVVKPFVMRHMALTVRRVLDHNKSSGVN
ncbi:MAG: response regulator [Syntrophobacteraceae bacterium]